MTCWRVENDDKAGPYRESVGTDLYEMSHLHSISDRHPAPRHVRGKKYTACAIDNPADLLRWFAGYWPMLFAEGFHIVEVMVDGKPASDFGQVIFEGAQRRRRVCISELLHDLLADGAYS